MGQRLDTDWSSALRLESESMVLDEHDANSTTEGNNDAFTQVFEDISTAVLLPAMNVAVGATVIAALALIILHSTQSKSLRVEVRNCIVLVLMTTVISAAASMMQICAAEDNEPTAENEVVQMPETGKSRERQELKNEVSNHKLVDELSDGIDIDSEWGSVYGRIRVTNPERLNLRRRLLLNGGANPNSWVDVFSDDFHPWMKAYWLVLDHPYSAITDQQGPIRHRKPAARQTHPQSLARTRWLSNASWKSRLNRARLQLSQQLHSTPRNSRLHRMIQSD